MASSTGSSSNELPIIIRSLCISDAAAIYRLLTDSPEAALWSPNSLEEVAGTNPQCLVAECNGAIVAFFAGRATADEFEVLNLAVSIPYRRTGIASKLLNYGLARAGQDGCTKAYLEVRASNRTAIGFYLHHNFSECGRRPKYYQSPLEDAVLFSRPLP